MAAAIRKQTQKNEHDQHALLIHKLQHADLFPHPVTSFEIIETHISWVLLTGPFAYKFKKPVDLGFLDFSTLALRKFYCEEELRLNRRLAPALYLEVIAIGGTTEQPSLLDTTPAIEYAVKMKQFSQDAQLDLVLQRGELNQMHIDKLAQAVAQFHSALPPATDDKPYGGLDAVRQPVEENFAHITRCIGEQEAARLQPLAAWCERTFIQLKTDFLHRKQNGFIREGHGDMHLRNMALLDEEVVLFDCLEFNPALRWIDVINDLAFLIMDLEDRQQPAFAWRCLNRYLELTGDYAGVTVLNYYKVYRALVRAKVDAIRLSQPHLSEQERAVALKDFQAYIKLAQDYTADKQPCLILTRGLSGSGKSTHTQTLLQDMGALRIRSDVERKRLYADTMQPEVLYSSAATQHTYRHLLELSESLLSAGQTVIVDATFIKSGHIAPFRQLAEQQQSRFIILEFTARPETLRERVRKRRHDVSDADIEVLEHQLQLWSDLPKAFQPLTITVDTEQPLDMEQLIEKIRH